MTENMWSATKVTAWRTCPRQFDQRYNHPRRDEDRELPSTSTVRRMGIVAHAGMQAAYEAAARVDASDFRNATTMARFIGEAVVAVRQHSSYMQTLLTVVEAAQVECEVAGTLARLPAPHPASVLGVEHRLLARTPAGRPIEGRMDLLLRTGPHSLHIRDWKRSALKTLPSANELAASDQLPFYRYLVGVHYPWVKRVTVGLYSLTSQAEVVTEIDGPTALSAMRACDVLAERAENAVSFPATPDPQECPRCPARDGCPMWRPAPPHP